MQTRTWPSELGEMRFAIRSSSDGRFWSGFTAATYDITGGIAERPATSSYTLVMHLSSPVSGTAKCEGPTLPRVMRPGDMDLVPLGYAAAWRDDGPGRVLNVRLSPSLLGSAAEAMRHAKGEALNITPQLHFSDPKLTHLGWALVADLEGGNQRDRLFAESIGNAIAAHLVGNYTAARTLEFAHGLSRRQLRAVSDYIDEHIATNLSLLELGALAGLSPSHFNLQFKKSTGISVHQYVIRMRVDHAIKLLIRSRFQLSEVAELAGFADQSHMARCMRRLTGMTPSALVRNQR